MGHDHALMVKVWVRVSVRNAVSGISILNRGQFYSYGYRDMYMRQIRLSNCLKDIRYPRISNMVALS